MLMGEHFFAKSTWSWMCILSKLFNAIAKDELIQINCIKMSMFNNIKTFPNNIILPFRLKVRLSVVCLCMC